MQQPPRMFGMPPGLSLPNQAMAMSHSGQAKIDPNQIPRLAPSASAIVHETRQGNQANPPPVIIFFLWFSLSLIYLPKVDIPCPNCYPSKIIFYHFICVETLFVLFLLICHFFVKPATSDYIVKDTGNCSPRYMRCTINQV